MEKDGELFWSCQEKHTSSFSQDAVSDVHNERSCNPCSKKGENVEVFGYCTSCIEYLCESCNDVHGRLALAVDHEIVTGTEMPASEEAKPQRYKTCSEHDKELSNAFCNKHNIIVCSKCCMVSHKDCEISNMTDMCNKIDSTAFPEFTKLLAECKMNMITTRANVEENIFLLAKQKSDILTKVKRFQDEIILEINKIYDDTLDYIDTIFETHTNELKTKTSCLLQMASNMESIIQKVINFKERKMDANLFIEFQYLAARASQSAENYNTLANSISKLSMSFQPNPAFKECISSLTFGSLNKHSYSYTPVLIVKKLTFPVESQRSKSTATQSHMKKLKASMKRSYCIKAIDDVDCCWITGIVITKYGRKLMADFNNKKVKMFTRNMELLSNVHLPDRPWGVSAINEKEAIASVEGKTLIILDISKLQVTVKNAINTPMFVKSVICYEDRFIISNQFSSPVTVNMIDKIGQTYWTTNLHHNDGAQAQSSTHRDMTKSNITVVDREGGTIHTLNAISGAIQNTGKLEGKSPQDITVGPAGNILATFMNTNEIAVLSTDFSDCKILLSHRVRHKTKQTDSDSKLSCEKPYALAYDDTTHELLVSYVNHDEVDSFILIEESN